MHAFYGKFAPKTEDEVGAIVTKRAGGGEKAMKHMKFDELCGKLAEKFGELQSKCQKHFDFFYWKCRKNGELPLKNDGFVLKNGHHFCNLRYGDDPETVWRETVGGDDAEEDGGGVDWCVRHDLICLLVCWCWLTGGGAAGTLCSTMRTADQGAKMICDGRQYNIVSEMSSVPLTRIVSCGMVSPPSLPHRHPPSNT